MISKMLCLTYDPIDISYMTVSIPAKCHSRIEIVENVFYDKKGSEDRSHFLSIE